VVLGLPVLLLGCLGVHCSLDDPSVFGVYLGFVSAIAIWGWFELAFLAGVITGPYARPCPEGVTGWPRFLRAWGAIAYSEMALIGATLALVLASEGAANRFAMWTFVVLFAARVTAKINVYLGVPNINDDFLPSPVRHLTTHFRKAPMNGFFPWSVTLLTFAVACWIECAAEAPPGTAQAAGFALLAALTALALFEHWMMVLPLPDAALWTWALPRTTSAPPGDDRAAPLGRPALSSEGRD
jgi:putative photosynthetic complex assembly protein 2